jgi:hypothetical protein
VLRSSSPDSASRAGQWLVPEGSRHSSDERRARAATRQRWSSHHREHGMPWAHRRLAHRDMRQLLGPWESDVRRLAAWMLIVARDNRFGTKSSSRGSTLAALVSFRPFRPEVVLCSATIRCDGATGRSRLSTQSNHVRRRSESNEEEKARVIRCLRSLGSWPVSATRTLRTCDCEWRLDKAPWVGKRSWPAGPRRGCAALRRGYSHGS